MARGSGGGGELTRKELLVNMEPMMSVRTRCLLPYRGRVPRGPLSPPEKQDGNNEKCISSAGGLAPPSPSGWPALTRFVQAAWWPGDGSLSAV